MMTEIDPKTTSRAYAFETWIQAPMPMVTLSNTLLTISFQFHHTQMDGAARGAVLG